MANTILTRGQRKLHTGLLALALFMLGNAAYLWVSPPEASVLPVFYQWALVLHVVVGTLLLVPMTVFVVWHLRRAFAMRNPTAVWTGIVVTLVAFALFVTGLFIFSAANSIENRWAYVSHQVLAVLAPLGYVFHRYVSHHKPVAWAVKAGVAAPLAVFLLSLGVHEWTAAPPLPPPQAMVERPAPGVDPFREEWKPWGPGGADPQSAFFPASTTTITGGFLPKGLLTNRDTSTAEVLEQEIKDHGFAIEARIGSETCERCHADVAEQWARSAHRYASFNNPFYRASIEALREEENGRQRSQWCAGCHDPAIMMAGNMLAEIEPTIPESQAGLTCLACHLMDEVHGVGGNGNYRIADQRPEPYLFADAKGGLLAEVHDALVRSKPDVHKRDMLKPVFRTEEYCAVCHKVSLDTPVNNYRWLRGQNEYDNHQDSGVSRNNARTFYLPPTAKRCHDCHMPLVDAPLGDMAAKGGKVRSHLFLGPNTALPHIRGDQDTVEAMERFLKDEKMRVDVFAVKRADGTTIVAPDLRPVPLVAGETVELQVVVRNLGVGHTFPGGTLDSNESWIHLTIADADQPGEPLFESGAMDPATRHVDRDAHHYRALFVDERSQEAADRNPHDFRALVHVKVIGPGTADIVRYRFTVPQALAGRRLVANAVLKWRKFRRSYTEFAWAATMPGRDLPELPITDIAAGRAEFPVVAGPAPEAEEVPATEVERNWVRWNDWGIGLLLQGDTRGAEQAFARVAEALPNKVDGWRNLARVKLRDGDNDAAAELLREAEERDRGNAQTAYFLGVVQQRLGDHDAAIAAFERAREEFQGDRTIHQNLGELRYKLGRYEQALEDFLAVLAIDPEDRIAHYHRMLIYGALAGDAEEPQERESLERAHELARQAFEKYTIDESAQEWTNEFRRKRPDVNLESQPVHVHELLRAAR